VTVLCGALLNKCLMLLEKGVHPTIISDAMNVAAVKACEVRPLLLAGAPDSVFLRLSTPPTTPAICHHQRATPTGTSTAESNGRWLS
jgi:hypothetical protein